MINYVKNWFKRKPAPKPLSVLNIVEDNLGQPLHTLISNNAEIKLIIQLPDRLVKGKSYKLVDAFGGFELQEVPPKAIKLYEVTLDYVNKTGVKRSTKAITVAAYTNDEAIKTAIKLVREQGGKVINIISTIHKYDTSLDLKTFEIKYHYTNTTGKVFEPISTLVKAGTMDMAKEILKTKLKQNGLSLLKVINAKLILVNDTNYL